MGQLIKTAGSVLRVGGKGAAFFLKHEGGTRYLILECLRAKLNTVL